MIGEEGLSIFSKTHKVGGEFIITDEAGSHTFASAQCVHCGVHWQVMPGSGRLRGYCYPCKGVLCGKEACMKECVCIEAQIEIMEGNKKTINKFKDNRLTMENLGIILP